MMETGQNYGLTAAKQQELFAIGQNLQLKRRVHYISLYETTLRAAEHAIDLCKAGNKDAARNWLRYFDNASILELLKESGEINGDQQLHLRAALTDLKHSCHPQEQMSLETDLQHIRALLERLVELTEQNKAPAFPFFSNRNQPLTPLLN